MWPLSETLLEEMVVKFEYKGMYCGTLHHGRWEIIPVLSNVIDKQECSAIKLYMYTS